jgi:hypothetical protein
MVGAKATLVSRLAEWWRSVARAVKAGSVGAQVADSGTSSRSGSARWSRHFEGWPLGVLTIAIAVTAVMILVPRPVVSKELPLPQVDRAEQRHETELDRARAERARREPLTYEVRDVGETLRRIGAAEHAGDSARVEELRRALRQKARSVLQRLGSEPLLRLRALQSVFFVEATKRWERSGSVDRELVELGGNFAAYAAAAGWKRADGALSLTDDDRGLSFRVRWAELAGLMKTPPFRPTLNERRAHYRVLLQRAATGGETARITERQLTIVALLGKLDPEYPVLLGRGLLLLRLGRNQEAERALRQHLASPLGNVWRLRARSALAAAVLGSGTPNVTPRSFDPG